MFSIIELHLSNKCTGDCVVCSKAHGGARAPYMQAEVFDAILSQLRQMQFTGTVQLGGDGDAFLHPRFLDFTARLRDAVPNAHLCLYTSGFSLTSERRDRIIEERLLDEMQVRIDSLNPAVYQQSTGLDFDIVWESVFQFAAAAKDTRLCLIYFPLYLYPTYCRKILGKEPTYFRCRGLAEAQLHDEFAELKRRVGDWGVANPVEVRRTGICLWAERTDCDYSDAKCPQLEENSTGAWGRQMYVLPDGAVMCCPYTDDQNTFILGNVLDDWMTDLWACDRKKAFADQVRNRTKSDHPAPCVNPKCCLMWDSLP